MSEVEDDLKKALETIREYDARRANSAGEKAARAFQTKKRRLMIIAWACLAVLFVVFIPVLITFVLSRDSKVLIACATITLVLGQMEVLTKLGYWIVHTRLTLQKEMKELQLQIAELVARDKAAEG
jgi:uncharacterized membrane protein YpjA